MSKMLKEPNPSIQKWFGSLLFIRFQDSHFYRREFLFKTSDGAVSPSEATMLSLD
jgi:hypothetical protein